MLQCTEVSDEMVFSLTATAEQALRENVLVLEKKPPHRGEMGKIRQKKMMGGKKKNWSKEIQTRNKPPLSTASSEG